MVTDQNAIQVFKMAEYSRIHTIKMEEKINHVRIDNRSKKLMVSTDKKIYLVDGGQIIGSMDPPVDDFKYVYPLYGGYFVVTSKGMLYYSSNVRF